MEQIYTIPVNEAFEASIDGTHECPFCIMRHRLEENELDLLLGASMMEPDVRIKTNELGFCPDHFHKLYEGGKALPFGLIVESHLNSVRERLKGAGILAGRKASADVKSLTELQNSCYICGRMDHHFTRMIATVPFLWSTDENFRRKLVMTDHFCYPHFAALTADAKERMDKKEFSSFYKQICTMMEEHSEKISDKVSLFCRQFDYRYAEERVGEDIKSAPQEAMKLLLGDYAGS